MSQALAKASTNAQFELSGVWRKMRVQHAGLYFLLVLLALLGTGCLGPRQGLFPPKPGERTESVYVVTHGWHTGLAIKRAAIPPTLIPEKADFPKAEYLEIGWGDDAWYRAKKGTIAKGFRAMFLCDRSVFHVVGFSGTPAEFFPESRITRVDVSESGFTNLCEFISTQFVQETNEPAPPLQPGLYGDSYFYRAQWRYYCLKTCNYWTASALREAGCPITPIYAVPSGNVLYQTRRFGTVVR
jgi:uncharacterized protein (TIGR02117 family)